MFHKKFHLFILSLFIFYRTNPSGKCSNGPWLFSASTLFSPSPPASQLLFLSCLFISVVNEVFENMEKKVSLNYFCSFLFWLFLFFAFSFIAFKACFLAGCDFHDRLIFALITWFRLVKAVMASSLVLFWLYFGVVCPLEFRQSEILLSWTSYTLQL